MLRWAEKKEQSVMIWLNSFLYTTPTVLFRSLKPFLTLRVLVLNKVLPQAELQRQRLKLIRSSAMLFRHFIFFHSLHTIHPLCMVIKQFLRGCRFNGLPCGAEKDMKTKTWNMERTRGVNGRTCLPDMPRNNGHESMHAPQQSLITVHTPPRPTPDVQTQHADSTLRH